jgi:hypothetical protein
MDACERGEGMEEVSGYWRVRCAEVYTGWWKVDD